MHGKVVVITGATSGIGEVAAVRLAASGARLVLVARDPARAEATLGRLRAAGSSAGHSVHLADLTRLSEMKRVGEEIANRESRVDALINNAGALFGHRQMTEDGLEYTFALNHMSYFVITHQLIDRLRASAPARIVNTASDAHQKGTLNFDDLQSARAYRGDPLTWVRYGGPGFKVYALSKLLNILFTRELARRLAGSSVTANSLHPGFVNTRFGEASGGLISFGIGFAKRFALTPEQGAETIVYLASSPEVGTTSGVYFDKCRPATPTLEAQDDAAAKRLWIESAKLAGFAQD